MNSEIILVYNPIAHGGKLAKKTINSIRREFQSVIVHPIRPSEGDGFGNLADIIRIINPQFVAVAGGDGTLNRYFNYAYYNDIIDIPVGIIPSGTANDFAGSLGIPNNIEKAIEIIRRGTKNKTDIISVTSGKTTKYCINVFSSGYLTCVSHSTKDYLKKKYGRLAYFIQGISEAIRPRRMKLKIVTENMEYEGNALLFLVMNGKTAGGMSFSKSARPDDGLLDITIFKGDNLCKTLCSAINILLKREYTLDVIHDRCKSIYIENPENNETDIDGDRGPQYPIKVQCLRGEITIIR